MTIVQGFNGILHGGDYNPDQWLDFPEVIDEDFRLMDKAGCNTFSVGIFSWSRLEPEEGVFDFAWLDSLFERAEKSGKHFFLATPSAGRPAWLGKKYPETNMVSSDGFRHPWKERQNCCYTSPVLADLVRRIDTELAKRYASHPALAGWHIGNEFWGECYCPRCLEKFHEFLHGRYGTLENLNRCYWSDFWSHRLTAWDQIDPRDGAVNAVRLDWRRFLSCVLVDFFRMEAETIRKYSRKPLTTNMMGLYGVIDYWKVVPYCDFIADDCYPTWYPGITGRVAAEFSALHDMHYSMLRKPFVMMESCPGIANYKPYVRLRRENEFQREMLMAVGHGADGTMYFQWRRGRGNCEQFHGAVVGHDGSDRTRIFHDVADYGAHLRNIAEIVGSERRPEAAVILDWESRWALELAAGFGGDAVKKTDATIFQHYRALSERNIDLAVIDSDAPFDGYRLITAPMLFLLKDGVAEKMKQFVRNGGTLVLTYLSAYVDESARCFFGGNPGGPTLRELFGVWSEDVDGLPPECRQTVEFDGRSHSVLDYAELLHTEGAEVLATYGSEFYAGTPAVTLRRSEKGGAAVYIGARTGLEFLSALYGKLSSECGLRPVLEGMPDSVRVTRRRGRNADYYFLLNMSDVPVRATLPFPMTDLWNGGKALLREVDLPAAGSTVLRS